MSNIKNLLSATALTLFAGTIFTAMPAFANGAQGHLYIGEQARKKLDPSWKTYQTLFKYKNEYMMGLLFPDAIINAPIKDTDKKVGNWGHSDKFLNAYIDDLASTCKKKYGTWRGVDKGATLGVIDYEHEACAKRFAHFFGSLGHIAADVKHDRSFLQAVKNRHLKHNDAVKFKGDKNDCKGNGDAKDTKADNEHGCDDNNKNKPPGSQYYTDVLIDFHIASHLTPTYPELVHKQVS